MSTNHQMPDPLTEIIRLLEEVRVALLQLKEKIEWQAGIAVAMANERYNDLDEADLAVGLALKRLRTL